MGAEQNHGARSRSKDGSYIKPCQMQKDEDQQDGSMETRGMEGAKRRRKARR